MLKYSKIKKPVFAINTDIVKKNISDMNSKLPASCTFRPHFKTHNNRITANLFREHNINKITVSSVDMAEYFRLLGFKDITIAFPVNIREAGKIAKICKNTKLGLCFSNLQSVKQLLIHNEIFADAWIEIDTGYNRSGFLWNDYDGIEIALDLLAKSNSFTFKGFLTHNGLTYSQRDIKGILASSEDSISKMIELKSKYSQFQPLISIGDTPTCSLMKDFSEIDEVRPGNFVYYDLMMLEKEVCILENIAATVLCPIVDLNPERNEIVIYGGAVHFSKEYIEIGKAKVFGKAINHIGNVVHSIDENIVSLSQEHGILKLKTSNINSFVPGDLLEIIPIHSCLTANLMKNATKHY